MNKKLATWIAAPVLLIGMWACGAGGSDDTGEAVTGVAADAKQGADADEAEAKPGIYKFGQTVKFKDGSTLTVGKPVKFKKGKYAAGGENKKVFLKFQSTFTNGTEDVFDPALTTGSASGDGEEADSIYQDGLDAPENKILPGKKVSWWMGYGFTTAKEIQLEVNVGFLDYGTVIFTN